MIDVSLPAAGGPAPDIPGETPDLLGAYPRLSDPQVASLAALGRRRTTRPGDVLFREGDRDYGFLVVLSGTVASVEGCGSPLQRVISVHGRGRFLGELSLLTGEGSFYSAVAVDQGQVLSVPVSRLRELISGDIVLSDLILRAYLLRRSILIGLGVGVRIIGSRYSPDTRRVRDFAARNRVPARWLDLDADSSADALLAQLGVAPRDTPLVIVYGRMLRNPSNAELAAAIGLPVPSVTQAERDLIVVGAGPAGLSAAVYGASEGMHVTVLDGVATGGQAGTSSRIENYLGFPSGISGAELADRALLQAQKFGASFAVPAQATAIAAEDGHYCLQLADGTSLTGKSVVIASGARYRRLDIPRMDYFEQVSVYYAASQAEALVCQGDPVVVVGGGNSAGQAAVFLSRHAAQVTMVVRDDHLGSRMSRYLVDQVMRRPNVRVMVGAEIRELHGQRTLEGVTVEDSRSGTRHAISARALFVFIGATPSTSWLGDLIDLDEHGFVLTGPSAPSQDPLMARSRRLSLETSRTGIFAVGDVRSGSAKRVAAAVGEGAIAIRLALERTPPA
ncbi:MAG: FAD-dependent oxidoreductase [Trebonia sp.]